MAALTRILRTAAVTLSHIFDPGEIPTAATGSVAVTLTRLDGTVVASGNATGPDENQAYTFPYAGSATLDILIVTWSATVNGDALTLDQDRLEIVGGHMFGLAEARNFDPKSAIADPVKYPTQLLADTRNEVEDEAERICVQAFVPRFARDVLDGTGQPWLKLLNPMLRTVRKVLVATTYGDAMVAFDAGQLSRLPPAPDGVIRLDSGFFWPASAWWSGGVWPMGRSNIIVEYEHGWDRPPATISRAGKIRIKNMLLEPTAAQPDRAESASPTLGIPDRESTGIPAVDAAYARVPSPRPGFG